MAESLPISGYIDPKSFPFLLVDLHHQDATGSLKVEGDHHQKALYFRAGRVLFGSSNDPRDQLGAILIESGKISEQQLEDVNKKVGPGHPLAKALADSGIVSQRELSEAARAKVERILSDVLSYESGSFEFEDGVLPKGAVDLKLSPERLFLAAVRRVKDRAFVLRHLDGLDVVLSETSRFVERLPEIESELGGLAPFLDGQRTLKEAASLAALDEFEAAKIGCGLLFLGLVEKGGAVVVVDGGAPMETPYYPEPDEETDLGLLPTQPPALVEDEYPAPPTVPFTPRDVQRMEEPDSLPDVNFPPAANDTLILGSVPSFSLPEISPPDPMLPPAQSLVPEPPPLDVPTFEPPPPQSASSPGLKITPPPDRSRPPGKPSTVDLQAIDDLLGRESPEGPLTPLQKSPADEWKPSLTARTARRNRRSSPPLVPIIGGVVVLAALVVLGWMYWTGALFGTPTQVGTASPAPAPTPSPAGAVPSTPASPAAAPSAETTAITAPAPGSPTPAPPAIVAAPTAAAPRPPATAAPPATTLAAVTPRPAAADSGTKPTTRAGAASGSSAWADARSLLRKGQYPEASKAFESTLRMDRPAYSIQALLACSPDTIGKAQANVGGDELFILALRYQGRDCYRIGWGVYASQAAADAGLRELPAYFTRGGNRPKVVKVTEMLR